jgi:quercetin dioxygenase-like cupin family protein
MPKGFTWPFQYETERPPVQLISGRAPMGVNRMAGPPLGAVPNAAWPLPPEAQTGAETFASIRHFEGETPKLDYIECHTSVLAPGASPHPLHNHDEEEILLVVRGEAEIQTANDGKGTNLTRTTLRPGDFGYYPALQFHTIVNASTAPVMYTMFKWRNDGGRSGRHDSLTFGRTSTGIASDGSPKHLTRLVEFGTRWLDRLQGHLSIASPPASYAAHADPYDVAIVLIEGAIETLGQPLEAPAVLYHPAGAMHGLAAVGDAPARYLVFEFDAQRIRTPLTSLMRLGPRGVSLARRAVKKLRREIGKRLR